MAASSPTAAQLFWIKTDAKGKYELVLDGQPFGWLHHGEYWSAESRAQFAGHTWLFRRPGSALGRTEILQGDNPRPIASYKSHWGGGTLTFSDGSRMVVSSKGVWYHIWSLLDANGEAVLHIEPKPRKVAVIPGQALAMPGEDRSRLLLLTFFLWHEILQAQDEAEMVAIMSATS
jgi:hypothetical protein